MTNIRVSEINCFLQEREWLSRRLTINSEILIDKLFYMYSVQECSLWKKRERHGDISVDKGYIAFVKGETRIIPERRLLNTWETDNEYYLFDYLLGNHKVMKFKIESAEHKDCSVRYWDVGTSVLEALLKFHERFSVSFDKDVKPVLEKIGKGVRCCNPYTILCPYCDKIIGKTELIPAADESEMECSACRQKLIVVPEAHTEYTTYKTKEKGTQLESVDVKNPYPFPTAPHMPTVPGVSHIIKF